ncbi:MAG TPA: class I SAM-dependent methyltransferase [Ornithinicoccus sp.]|nr:class I SAM-dependent methyltransferase [Ornithinicoccus sp.]
MTLSPRLQSVVDALPLRPGLRVLEIGGAPGAAARAVTAAVAPGGHVLVVDRSARGISLTQAACAAEITAGLLSTLCAPVEDFTLSDELEPFDLAFACRVGALDGRHPRSYAAALDCLRAALRPGAPLFVDTGDPLERVDLW